MTDPSPSANRTVTVDGVTLRLSHPDDIPSRWIGNLAVRQQLVAAWMVVAPEDVPLNPRLIGRPGVGKTTLATSVARELGREVYVMQCTMDTRPEDLVISPVIADSGKIAYHASPLVTAMLRGGTCILDEGNRMSEKSWASLAALLDMRRTVESIVAGIKLHAHPDFRLCVTMNDDASTYEVPEYIQSRLQPQIEVAFPEREEELEILRFNVPFAEDEVLAIVTDFLYRAHRVNMPFSTRDGVNILRLAIKKGALLNEPAARHLSDAIEGVLGIDGANFADTQQPPQLEDDDLFDDEEAEDDHQEW